MTKLKSPQDEVLSLTPKAQKRKELNESDWVMQRHYEQLELVKRGHLVATTLTDTEFEQLLIDRQNHRDI